VKDSAERLPVALLTFSRVAQGVFCKVTCRILLSFSRVEGSVGEGVGSETDVVKSNKCDGTFRKHAPARSDHLKSHGRQNSGADVSRRFNGYLRASNSTGGLELFSLFSFKSLRRHDRK